MKGSLAKGQAANRPQNQHKEPSFSNSKSRDHGNSELGEGREAEVIHPPAIFPTKGWPSTPFGMAPVGEEEFIASLPRENDSHPRDAPLWAELPQALHEMLGDEGLCTYFRRGFLVAEMGIHVGERREREFARRPFAGRAPGSAPLWSALSAGTLLWASVTCLLVADSLAVLCHGHCPTRLLQLICGHLSSTL